MRRSPLIWLILLSLAVSVQAASLNLTWEPPTTNDDGTPLTDLSHYRRYMCVGPGCTPVAPINLGNVTSYTEPNLTGGTRYRFQVTAVNTSGNESARSNLVEATTLADPPQTAVVAINAGGGAFTTSADMAYSADQLFSGGTPYSTTSAIANTGNDPLYQTGRFGHFSYAIPVTNGAYQLTLHFSEPVFTANGARVFHVTAEGTQLLQNFDIYAQAPGHLVALDKSFQVIVNDGTLNVQFQSVVNYAYLNAITLQATGSPPVPPGATTVNFTRQ